MTFGHPTGCLRQSISASLRFPVQEHSQGLKKKVKPLPSRTQGTATLKTPSSGQLLRDTRASKRHSYWKKFRCLHRLMLESCVGQGLPHSGHPKRLPLQNPASKAAGVVRLHIDIELLSVPLRVARPP
jgi:hypothetical protein